MPTSVPAEMVSNRPDVRKKEYAVIAADASVAVARKKMYPSLSISVSGGLNAIKASNWFSMPASLFATLTGSISQPILQHRELKTNYEVSQIQRNEAVINFKQATLDALGEVANALVSIDKLKTQRTLTTEEVATTQKAIVNAQFLFKSAEANYLEVTTAQGNALSAELDLADIQRQQLAAMIDLYQSLGGGWK